MAGEPKEFDDGLVGQKVFLVELMVQKICWSTLLPTCCMVQLFNNLTHLLLGEWWSLLDMDRHQDVDIF